MQRIRILLWAILGLSLSGFSQNTYLDFSTGQGTVGAADPNWTVLKPGATSYGPVYITTGLNQVGSTNFVFTSWVQNSCATYISPEISSTTNHATNLNTVGGNYTYKIDFNLADCQVVSSELSVDFIAADDSIVSITLNGTPLSIPSSISFRPGTTGSFSSFVSTSSLNIGGANELKVTVHNKGSWNSLQLCGGLSINQVCCDIPQIQTCGDPCNNLVPIWITNSQGDPLSSPDYSISWSNGSTSNLMFVSCSELPISATVTNNNTRCDYNLTYDCPCCNLPAPANLSCFSNGFGGADLSWSPLNGAVEYQIEVMWNDPAYCSTGNAPSVSVYTSTSNVLSIPSPLSPCFSYRIRAKCSNGVYGPWSTVHSCETDPIVVWGKVDLNNSSDPSIDSDFTIQPNPFNADVELVFDNMPADGTMHVVIIDGAGKVIYEQEMNVAPSLILNTEEWSRGLYLCKVSVNGNEITHKMIKE